MSAIPPERSLIDYPCLFPVKVMGRAQPKFQAQVIDIARRFDPDFDASTIECRPSARGNYLALTLTIHATSRQQLDDLYRALSGHASVSVVL